MEQRKNLTHGSILGTLIKFALPVLLALFLQALYGGVDLLIVGKFAETADVSGVATGSMLTQSITQIVTGLAMGITVVIGERIGARRPDEAGKAIGAGLCLFAVVAGVLTVLMVGGAEGISWIMQAPESAFGQTATYVRICGIGAVFIVAYNLLGAIFRGVGDSRTPLITVAISCVLNIGGDLLLVAVFHLGTAGAAIATVVSQGISVLISLLFIRKMKLPFHLRRKDIRFTGTVIRKELRVGAPIALQEFLVCASFLVIQAVVNGIGVVESAGVGVGEKLCAFIMLVPSAYMQSMSAFVAQNMGAQQPHRAKKALLYGILTSLAVGIVMGYLTVFHGDLLSAIFANEAAVIDAAKIYLMGFGIDCVLTPFLFCLIGYFNGREKTLLVMVQGIVGAVVMRMPLVLIFGLCIPKEISMFFIGIATPMSSVVQIIICLSALCYLERKGKQTPVLSK